MKTASEVVDLLMKALYNTTPQGCRHVGPEELEHCLRCQALRAGTEFLQPHSASWDGGVEHA